ncbi:hypothetical protein BDQ17DRAFT_1367325 [Cyathus striatus]|nr:hypothetical protein BDQ17DRAFT_1367325 [Cyathus striatus]
MELRVLSALTWISLPRVLIIAARKAASFLRLTLGGGIWRGRRGMTTLTVNSSDLARVQSKKLPYERPSQTIS